MRISNCGIDVKKPPPKASLNIPNLVMKQQNGRTYYQSVSPHQKKQNVHVYMNAVQKEDSSLYIEDEVDSSRVFSPKLEVKRYQQ